jgi:FkbM family methyltransferase
MSLDLSAISHKKFIGKILRLPLKLIHPKIILPVLQGRLKGRLWITGSSNHGCWLGNYEYEERILLEKTVGRGGVVFDIGAHVGFYTLLASVLVGPEGKVFSFEPVPRNLFFLHEHLRINNISNVKVIRKAVSNSCGIAYFGTNASSYTWHFQEDGNLQVETISLDELIAKQFIPIPDFIKIDVEGAEFLVLSGARKLLEANKITIFLATHGRDLHRKCCDFLKSINFELEPMDGKAIEDTDSVIAYKKEEKK